MVTEPRDEHRFETRAIHVGQEPDPTTGAAVVPIYQTSTYVQEEVGVHKGYEYSRTDNPTRTALQEVMASLEGTRHSLAFSSGMAATATLCYLLRPGDHVLVADDVYGGTYRLVSRVLAEWGIAYDTVDMTDLDAVKRAVHPETRLAWIETPTNPLLKIIDIARVAEITREIAERPLVAVDNTFASPYLQLPVELGADIALHSTTKYIGGHSDVVGGALCYSDDELHERLRFLQNSVGAVPSPFDCFLTLRGIKTLAVRMEAHSRNGRRVAEFLAEHPKVRRVYYPGLPDHPGHELAARQMRDFGGMVSFELDSEEEALQVARSTKVFFLGESLGGVESLIEHPGRMTHMSVAGSPLEVPATLLRLSVGIEHPDDLIADLEQVLG
ncbi:MAG TPA: cystathionine gamma-synthase [Actinomycetota bacterium]|nr:cystathionine gamma-synthase [Actinomycetota bacterium]